MNQPANTAHSFSSLTLMVERLKAAKEFILIVVFFVTGAIWVVNYYATREALDNYKCLNDATITMLVNSQNQSFMEEVIRSARRELRSSEDALEQAPAGSEIRKTLTNQAEDQKMNLGKLEENQKKAEDTKSNALEKIRRIQLGEQKPCS